MRKTLVPALRHTLGPIGMVVKYGAIGLAAVLGKNVLRRKIPKMARSRAAG